MKTVILMRHADSYPTDFSGYKDERPVSVTGFLQIEKIRAANEKMWSEVDFVLCSGIKRAKQTFQAIYSGVHSNTKFIFDDDIEKISASGLMNKIEWIPAIYGKVLIVGHNPCLSLFLSAICPSKKVPVLDTCEAAILQADVESWQDVDFNRFTLIDRIRPNVPA
jgi:phosphohistidine phosphatase SixA